MSVSSFLNKDSKLYPSGLEGDAKTVGCWQDVLLSIEPESTPDDIVDPSLLGSDEVQKQQDFQYVMDTICSVPAGREVILEIMRLHFVLGYKDEAAEPALYDAKSKKLMLSSQSDYALEDKAAFLLCQCARAIQDSETAGQISEAEAKVVTSIFITQIRMLRPDIYEKMTFWKQDKLAGMCEHLYSSLKDWEKTAAELFKFCK